MTSITLRVIDGANRGQVFDEISVPVTVGREEGNSIQLNDERVSRFHLRIQKDHDDLVLTDLESTNGSRVNNEEVQLRILRPGDVITIGRSTLLFGSRTEIKERLHSISGADGIDNKEAIDEEQILKQNWRDPKYVRAKLDGEPPRIPHRLSPGQAAQLSEVIEYLHIQMRQVIDDADIKGRSNVVELNAEHWQQILEVQSRLAEYLGKIGQPAPYEE
jgi:pSer/pThr/pTyr-binding forkhead associated (FHA) protein